MMLRKRIFTKTRALALIQSCRIVEIVLGKLPYGRPSSGQHQLRSTYYIRKFLVAVHVVLSLFLTENTCCSSHTLRTCVSHGPSQLLFSLILGVQKLPFYIILRSL